MDFLARIRALPGPVWSLSVGMFINRLGGFVVPFLAIYLTQGLGNLGMSAADAGLCLSAYGVGHLLASFVGGHLADSLGRRRTIALSMFSSAALMLVTSQARTLQALLPLTCLLGLCAELFRPASSALLVDLVAPAERLSAFGLYRLAANAGFAAGPVLAGLLARRSFYLLFVGDALTSAVFGLVALVALKEPRPAADVDHAAPQQGALRHMLGNGPFLRLLLSSTAVSAVFFQFESSFPLYVRDLGFDPAVYGMLASVNGLSIVLLELPLTQVTRRHPALRVLMLGYVLIGVGFGITGLLRQALPLAAGVLLWSLGEMCTAPVASTYVANLAPATMRGRYMGAYGLTWSLGLILGPSVGMRVYGYRPGLLWGGCVALGVLAALLLGLPGAQRQRRRDPAA